MTIQLRLAVALFVLNASVSAWCMWQIRPRTVASMDRTTLVSDELAALGQALAEAGVDANRVRVCEAEPCTLGPAIIVDGGRVQRLELPKSSRPSQTRRRMPAC